MTTDTPQSVIALSDLQQQPLPHPGIFYGAYPYKKAVEKGKLETLLDDVRRRFVKPGTFNKKQLNKFVERVHLLDAALQKMSDQALDKWILDIRNKLQSKGLEEEITARAFATIREIAGRELGMRHYDCQLIGGYIMLNGRIAEMQTGEGKTLTATLTAGCAALAGMPVHVVTVNDYLVERDAELMRPVYERLGLSVDYVTENKSTEERKLAYACDVTYCTSNQLAFDYLRDRLLLRSFRSGLEFKLESLYNTQPARDQLLMRGLNFAVVDEADSVFIDEARTPLILSCKTDNTQREEIHREAIWLAQQLQGDRYFILDEKSRHVELTQLGKTYLEEISANMRGIWHGSRRRTALVEQALAALHLYQRDVHYLVDDGDVVIIDENTGRQMPDRTWESGLHQMIEEKEGCDQTGQTETLARISYQRFFSRYLRLAGMTGTATEVSGELAKSYGLDVITVPTNQPVQRIIRPDYIYTNKESKWQAVIGSVQLEHDRGRPVLIGTRTVKDSELLSELLSKAGLPHQVLNAKQDTEEAKIIEQAGIVGQITVATNMAGRGTDIKLTAAAREAGGLHVISCEKNSSARIDRQLAGRCGRQGDPGSYEAILSLQDVIIEERLGGLRGFISRTSTRGGRVRPVWLGRFLMGTAQNLSEYYYRQVRKSLTKVDEKRESMLAFSGLAE